jgi:hypothetical protein
MFLRTNKTALLERIETTGLDVDGEHRRKIERLLLTFGAMVRARPIGHIHYVQFEDRKKQTTVFEGDTATSMDRICFGASENGI